MHINWFAFPLGLFGLLNIVLAFVAPQQAQGAGGAAAVFALAAGLTLFGLWRGNVLLIALGLLCAMISPVWMGILMNGRVNWLHILVRLIIVALCFGLWLKFRSV